MGSMVTTPHPLAPAILKPNWAELNRSPTLAAEYVSLSFFGSNEV
jgi:hypothetical protein